MEKESAGANQVVTRVVVHYRQPDGTEQSFTMDNTAGGEAIDGVCWNAAVVKRLVYKKDGQYVEPKKERGRGWQISGRIPAAPTIGGETADLESVETMTLVDDPPNCVWVHTVNCSWLENCTP